MELDKVGVLGFGDIGYRLFEHLKSDYQCIAISRTPKLNVPYWRRAYASGWDDLRDAITDLSVLVMTLTPAARSDEAYRAGYVVPVQNVVSICKTMAQPPLLIFVSSTAVLHQSNGEWVDESSACEPQRFNGKRMLEAEQLLQDSGLPYCIVRCSGIYGPGRGRLIRQVQEQMSADDFSMASNTWTNRIHSEDCAGFIAHLISMNEKQRLPLYIASDDRPTPSLEVKKTIAQLMGHSMLTELPEVSGGKRCRNTALTQSGYQLQYPSCKEGYAGQVQNEH